MKSQQFETVSEKIILKIILITKVIVLKESETIGLTKSENLKGHHSIARETRWSLAQIGEKQLKQNAAKKGCQFIVITSNKKIILRLLLMPIKFKLKEFYKAIQKDGLFFRYQL
jgi:hypothetical protein